MKFTGRSPELAPDTLCSAGDGINMGRFESNDTDTLHSAGDDINMGHFESNDAPVAEEPASADPVETAPSSLGAMVDLSPAGLVGTATPASEGVSTTPLVSLWA